MEKRIWTRPLAEVERFMANDYIAKCEDTENRYYKFVCNAGGGAYGGAWQESNGVSGLQSSGRSKDTRISRQDDSFHACQIEHYAPLESTEFLKNCYYKSSRQSDSEAIPVIIWRGEQNNNTHCTTFLDDQIEIVKGNKS